MVKAGEDEYSGQENHDYNFDLSNRLSSCISEAALFDTSSTGKLLLTGPDAPMFLGNLSTNDTKNLPLGGGCEAYFCDSRRRCDFRPGYTMSGFPMAVMPCGSRRTLGETSRC